MDVTKFIGNDGTGGDGMPTLLTCLRKPTAVVKSVADRVWAVASGLKLRALSPEIVRTLPASPAPGETELTKAFLRILLEYPDLAQKAARMFGLTPDILSEVLAKSDKLERLEQAGMTLSQGGRDSLAILGGAMAGAMDRVIQAALQIQTSPTTSRKDRDNTKNIFSKTVRLYRARLLRRQNTRDKSQALAAQVQAQKETAARQQRDAAAIEQLKAAAARQPAAPEPPSTPRKPRAPRKTTTGTSAARGRTKSTTGKTPTDPATGHGTPGIPKTLH